MSKDTIYRQDAIDAICNACGKIDCDKMDKCEKLQLPPANCSEIPNNSDTISRQAAIDALTEYGNGRAVYISVEEAVRRIEQLPSAQSEIIRCKDCKYYSHPWHCEAWNNSPGFPAVSDEMFCSMAERRTDERTDQ